MASALVVNADDLGVSKGATLGVIRAHREGIVTSASLAVTTPFYAHALETCVRACPGLGIGLHFTLTSGKPVSPMHQVPLLVDGNGFFRWGFVSLLLATTVRAPKELLDQVEIELEAQLQRLINDGVRPDHINGERHIHLIPAVFDRVVAAAKRHGIPFVRLGRDIGWDHAVLGHWAGLALGGGMLKSWLLSRLTTRGRRRLGGGTLFTEHVASYLYTGRFDLLMKSLLKSPPPHGTLEIMVHPGVPEESRNLALGNSELERYLTSEDRRAELSACIAARGLLDGWKLTTFASLARERAEPMIVPLALEHVDQVAALHCATLTGLLSELGAPAVRAFYTGCVRARSAVGFVDLHNGEVRGFVLGSARPGGLKRAVLRQNPAGTTAGVLLGLLRRPAAIAWLMKSFKGPDEGGFDGDEPELTYLAVSPTYQKSGVGARLVDAFTRAMSEAGVPEFALSVDDDNAAAAAFYERRGFKPIGRYREFGAGHRRYRLRT